MKKKACIIGLGFVGLPMCINLASKGYNVIGIEKKDYKGLETLSPANRDAWFAEHIRPEHIRYYSVVSFPDPENISNGLPHSHKKPNVMERRPQRQPAGVLRSGDSRLDRTGVL